MSAFGNKKIEFPVQYAIKVIMTNENSNEENILTLTKILTKFNIPHENWATKDSSQGKYTRYSVDIEVKTKQIMALLYEELQKEKSVKFAL